MISTLLLGILSVLILGYTAWKDWEHRRQIEKMALLLKAKDVPEFVQSQIPANDTPPAEPPADFANLEDVDPSELVSAIRKQ